MIRGLGPGSPRLLSNWDPATFLRKHPKYHRAKSSTCSRMFNITQQMEHSAEGFMLREADPVLMKKVNSWRSELACSHSARDSLSILAYFMSQSYSLRAGALSGQRWPSSWRAGTTFIFDHWCLMTSGCISTAQVAPWGVRLLLHPPGAGQLFAPAKHLAGPALGSTPSPTVVPTLPLCPPVLLHVVLPTLYLPSPDMVDIRLSSVLPQAALERTAPEEQSESLDESREKSSLTFKWTPKGREAAIVRSP